MVRIQGSKLPCVITVCLLAGLSRGSFSPIASYFSMAGSTPTLASPPPPFTEQAKGVFPSPGKKLSRPDFCGIYPELSPGPNPSHMPASSLLSPPS